MKNRKLRVLAALFIAIIGIQANASVGSKTMLIESPSDLPEVAQGPAEAMYLYHTGHAQELLYLEKDEGRTLAILDVADPAHIKAVRQVSIAASSTYDFVQNLGPTAVLIRYRDHSGFATISFNDYKRPVLTAHPDYLHPANAEHDGTQGELLISANASGTPRPEQDPQYQILSLSGSSGATPLVTLENVIQRVDRPETGTIFLLNDKGVTVVRRLSPEYEYLAEIKHTGGGQR